MATKGIRLGIPVPVSSGVITARPSKNVKSPYVCDMFVQDSVDPSHVTGVLGHTPSLGCNGMVDAGATVVAVRRLRKGKNTDAGGSGSGSGSGNEKKECEYSVIGSIVSEKGTQYVVGVDPSVAERFAGEILTRDVIPGLKVSNAELLQKQKTYGDCRFDYCGVTDDGEPFVCEVKNVSIANYEDLPPKQLAKMDFSERAVHSKVAVFPSGYKPKGQTHSERALKHTRTLMEIKQTHNDEIRCVILFIIQRDDVTSFQPSNGDEQYRNALREAHEAGVEVYAVKVGWDYDEVTSLVTPMVPSSSSLLHVNGI